MRRLEEVQIYWWVQNRQHLPQVPVPHAEVRDSTELPAGRKIGSQHLACQVPRRHACSDGINILSRIPRTTFGIGCIEQPHQSLAILGTGQPSSLAQEGFASTLLSSLLGERLTTMTLHFSSS